MKIFKNSVLLITVLAIFSNLLGFVREVLIAYLFGAQGNTDAFYVALTIPTVVLAVVGNVLMTIIVPIYSKYRENQKDAVNIISGIFTIILTITIPIVTILFIFSTKIISLLGTGMSHKDQLLAFDLLIILLPIILFGSLMHVLNGVLESHSVFGVSAFSGVINNLIVVVGILTFGYFFSIYGITIATLLGFFAGLATQLYFWKRIDRPFKITINWRHPALKEMFILSIPVAISTFISQSYLFTDRYLASFLEEGSVTALNFASKISLLPIITFAASLSVVTYTRVTNTVIANDRNEFNQILIKNFNVLLLVMMPISLIFLFFSGEIINLLFRYGNFDYSAYLKTKEALFFYSIGILPNSISYLLYRIYYAHKKTWYASTVGIIGVFSNILLSFLLVKPLGIGGIAIANSISFIIIMLLLFVPLNRFTMGVNLIDLVKGLPVLIVMTMSIWGAFALFEEIPYFSLESESFIHKVLSLLIPCLSGLIIYVISGLLFKNRLLYEVWNKYVLKGERESRSK
ncbi:murein biosynthesis integral membrane protein MurJ [Bacillus sp. Y1]|nr:murein biosynthesis integral membrane protein MurJ [Bacillus sp. Y1]AYA78049.1 murein biosynthesis integral membrane protein MurJ [Bacillus sp. Y1]